MDSNQHQISDRVQALAPSATLAMSQLSADLQAQGVDVANLAVGEPDFFTPDHIKAAARKAVDDNCSFYTPVSGYLSLREAIADKLLRENGLQFTPDQIVVGNGAKHSLANTLLALVNPGDEVLVPTPAWVSYVELVKLCGGRPVLLPAPISQDFKITPAQLADAITPHTRAIILCSPSNPTGSVYSAEELSALADVLARHPQVTVVSDEIYEHINYTGHHASLAAVPELADRVAVINGVSKAYAMTGWRIGYVAAPLWLSKAVNKLQGQQTSNASSIAQKAAEAAYRGPQQCVAEMREAFRRRRDLVVGLLRQAPGLRLSVPQGAFYVFPDVTAYLKPDSPIATANDLAMHLLRNAHVATVAGDAFCAPGHIRLSYAAADDVLAAACKRIVKELEKL